MMRAQSDCDVVLLGSSLPGVENHAIGALRAALREAHVSDAFVPFRGFTDMDDTIRRVLSHRPRVVGVSLQTIESVIATVTFTRMLRLRGYKGRIVVGGHFANLNAEDILRSPGGIDAVVRFAGEEAVVAVARGALNDDAIASRTSGLVFRDLDGEVRTGAPPKWTSPAILARTPRFDVLPEHLGFPAADLISSRGCEAHCSYCCIAAASDLARTTSTDGASAAYERRTVASLAEEIATLYHEQGARVFNFMDDNILPLQPNEAADWALELRKRLDAERVPEIALSLQLRADVVTERSAEALSRLGLCRAYVGVDGYSASQLRALGRRADPASGSRALALLWKHDIFAVVNALLVGPTIPFESVLSEVEALSRIDYAPVHLLPIEVRAGTSYFRAAQRRGLVEGGFLHWHYRFADARTERIGEILTAFPTRLAERSVPIALYDLGYNLGIARRLLPALDIAPHVESYARVTAAWNSDQIRLLRAAIAVAATDARGAVTAFVEREVAAVTATDQALRSACDRAMAEIEHAASRIHRRTVAAHARGKLLGAVAFSMSLAACGGSTDDGRVNSPDQPDAASATGGSAGNGSGGSGGGLAGASSGGATNTGGTSGQGSGGEDAASMSNGGSGIADAASLSCPDGSPPPAPSGDGYALPGLCCPRAGVRVTFDDAGHVVDFSYDDGNSIMADVRQCLVDLFASVCYPSLAGTSQIFTSHCWIA